MKRELMNHLKDIIADSKESIVPLEIALEKYAEALLDWFNKGKNTMQYRTVTIELTTQEDNLTDLINLYAQMGFVSRMSAQELIDNAKHVIEEEYTKFILTTNETPTKNKVSRNDEKDVED